MTDEKLKQKWIEYGCTEEFVDRVIAEMKQYVVNINLDDEIQNPFGLFYGLTYIDEEEFQRVISFYNGTEETRSNKELSEEELLKLKEEIENDPPLDLYFDHRKRYKLDRCVEKAIDMVLKKPEMKGEN